MRLIGILLAGCVALALLQLAAKAAAIIFLILAVFALINSPRESLGCLTTLVILGLASQYPLIMIPALIGLAVLGIMAKR